MDGRVQSVMRLQSIFMAACLALLLGLTGEMLISPLGVLAAGNTVTVHIMGELRPPGFRPDLVTVHVDDTIIFINDAQPSATYTIAADDHSFVSPPIMPSEQWSVTFSKPGTHEYSALGVSQQMVGTIIVAPASVTLLSTPVPGAVATAIATARAERAQSSGQSLLGTIVILAALVVALVVGGVIFLRRRRHV